MVSIANIGQSMPNSDAKVFEVKIKVFGEDPDLKPAMTTSNVIFTNTYADTLFIPTDAVFENDSLQFVYLQKGKITRQIVKLTEANENFVIIARGLKEGDLLCLNEPDNPEEIPFEGLEIYAAIRKEKEEKEKKEMQERENALEKRNSTPAVPSGMTVNPVPR